MPKRLHVCAPVLLCALALSLCAANASAQTAARRPARKPGRKPRVTQIESISLPPIAEPKYVPRSAVAPGQTVWCDADPWPPGTEYGLDVVGKTDPLPGCRGETLVVEIPTGAKREEARRRAAETDRDVRALEEKQRREFEAAIVAGRVILTMDREQARRAWGNPDSVRRGHDSDGNDIETWFYKRRGRLRFFNDLLDRIVEY